jgi:predicted ATPase
MRVVPEALVGRDADLAELAALLDRTRQGDGGVAFFEGPVGIGKTALLDAGAAMASGMRVLRGRCGEVERDLSFGLVRDLFEPLLRSASPSDRRRWLSGAASDASAVGLHV